MRSTMCDGIKLKTTLGTKKKASASKMIEPMSISCDMLSFNTYGERKEKRRENKTFKLLLY